MLFHQIGKSVIVEVPNVFVHLSMFPIFKPFIGKIVTPRNTNDDVFGVEFTKKRNVLKVLQTIKESNDIEKWLILQNMVKWNESRALWNGIIGNVGAPCVNVIGMTLSMLQTVTNEIPITISNIQ